LEKNATDHNFKNRGKITKSEMSNSKRSTKATKSNEAPNATNSIRELFLKSSTNAAAENAVLSMKATEAKKKNKRAAKITKIVKPTEDGGEAEKMDKTGPAMSNSTGNSFMALDEASSDEEKPDEQKQATQAEHLRQGYNNPNILKEILASAGELPEPWTDSSNHEDSEYDSQLSGEEDQ
jgi:hypothetical protein